MASRKEDWYSKKKRIFQDTLKFYHTFFNFNPPFYILMDGSFICAAIASNQMQIQGHLSAYFKGKCKLFTTPCALMDLETTYPNNKEVDYILESISVNECPHSKNPQEGSFCLTQIASRNQYKKASGPPRGKKYRRSEEPLYIIATQNGVLLSQLRNLPSVPVIYFDKGVVAFDRPSEGTCKWAEAKDLKKMESLAIEVEVLQHALLEEAKRPVDNIHESKITSSVTTTPADVQNASRGSKRRDLSPDICDFNRQPKSNKVSFTKYRSLVYDETGDLGVNNDELDNRQNSGAGIPNSDKFCNGRHSAARGNSWTCVLLTSSASCIPSNEDLEPETP